MPSNRERFGQGTCVSERGTRSASRTLEGLGTPDKPHLQKAFIDEQAAQCGYCTSGMIIAAADLLKRNPQPTEGQVRSALAGNLCHNRIIRAVMRVA